MASQQEVLAEYYEVVAGPLSWTDAETAVGECRGQRVVFSPYSAKVGDNRVLRGARVSVDLGGRVITAEIDNRKRTSLALPEVTVGDPEFDELFVVHGWPEKAIRNALDDDTRLWLTESWPHGFPPVSVEGRWLQGRFGLFKNSATPEMSTEEFRSLVEQLAGFGTGLIAAYDRERAEEVRYGGEDAGRSWDANLVALETKRGERRTIVRTAVLGGLALIALLVLVAIVFGSGIVSV